MFLRNSLIWEGVVSQVSCRKRLETGIGNFSRLFLDPAFLLCAFSENSRQIGWKNKRRVMSGMGREWRGELLTFGLSGLEFRFSKPGIGVAESRCNELDKIAFEGAL